MEACPSVCKQSAFKKAINSSFRLLEEDVDRSAHPLSLHILYFSLYVKLRLSLALRLYIPPTPLSIRNCVSLSVPLYIPHISPLDM